MAIVITDSNFDQEVLNADSPVFVECYAEWCGPCKVLKPVLVELEESSKRFKLGLLDIDHNPELAKRLKIATIPKVIVFHKGEEITSMCGIRPKADYQGVIDSL